MSAVSSRREERGGKRETHYNQNPRRRRWQPAAREASQFSIRSRKGGTACACTIRTTLGSGSSTMRRLGSWNRFHIWKRLTRAYLAMWWRAAMRLLLAAMARRRLRYRDVLDPEYFLDSPALLTSRDADHPWAECSRVQPRGRWACIGHPLGRQGGKSCD